MKNYLFLLSLGLLFLSCNTEKLDSQEQNIDLSKIENVKNLIGDEQPVAFRLLNNAEKATLWQQRTDYILNNENLSDIQRRLLLQSKKFLVPELYNNNSKKQGDIRSEILTWEKEVRQQFTTKQSLKYFSTIDIASEYPGEDNCGCSLESDWCFLSDCEGTYCTVTYNSCGSWWSYNCDGGCF